ncbi:MAG: hypothetical protein SWY16_22735 [Cyanobacteriota bacterium]|nr:hypothetical protein [Cyanobacteriota bacterium]
MAEAWDFWSDLDKERFQKDGTLKPEVAREMIAKGMDFTDTIAMELKKYEEIRWFDRRDREWLEKYGETWSDWKLRHDLAHAKFERQQREKLGISSQQAALENGEELSTLPIAIDPDEYYSVDR